MAHCVNTVMEKEEHTGKTGVLGGGVSRGEWEGGVSFCPNGHSSHKREECRLHTFGFGTSVNARSTLSTLVIDGHVPHQCKKVLSAAKKTFASAVLCASLTTDIASKPLHEPPASLEGLLI